MIKGLLLAISIGVFVVSLVLLVSGLIGALQENIITGAVVGSKDITNYSFPALILSFLSIFIIASLMKKSEI